MAISSIGGSGSGATSTASPTAPAGMALVAGGYSSLGTAVLKTTPNPGTYNVQNSVNALVCRYVVDYGVTTNMSQNNSTVFTGQNTGLTATNAVGAGALSLTGYHPWVSAPGLSQGGAGSAVAYLNGTWFCLDNVSRVYNSTDGITWTYRAQPGSGVPGRGLAFGNGTYVMVGSSASVGTLATSSDGNTWTNQSAPSAAAMPDIAFGAGTFVLLYPSGVLASTNGSTGWSVKLSQVNLTSVAHNGLAAGSGSLFVTVGANYIASSPDGNTWTPRTEPSGQTFYSVAYGNGLWVAVGTNSTIITSPDGITWTQRSNSFLGNTGSLNLCEVAFGGGRWVTYTDSATASVNDYHGHYVSSDGLIWRPANGNRNTQGVTNLVRGMAYGGGRFVKVNGANSALMHSTNGINGAPGTLVAFSDAFATLN